MRRSMSQSADRPPTDGTGRRDAAGPGSSGLVAPAAIFGATAALWGSLVAFRLAWDLRFEDALIVLRYARNLVAGEGFVYNPGERILGVTTPLHTLLSTVYVALGGAAAPSLQNVAGLLCLVAEAFLLLLLLHRLGHQRAALPAALLVLGNFNLNYLYFGMETHLFAALVLLVLYLHIDGRGPAAVGAAIGLAFLVRYDAALLGALVGIDAWRRQRRPPWRLALAFAAVTTPWLLFAQLYFGSILPAPLAAKHGFVPFAAYLHSIHDLYQGTFQKVFALYLPGQGLPHLMARGTWLLLALGAALAIRRDRRFFLLALYPVSHLLIYASLGSDPGFTWHVYLLNPFGFAFLAIGVSEIVATAGRLVHRRWPPPLGRLVRRWGPAALVAVATAPLLVHLARQANHSYRMDPLTSQLHTMGAWLKERYPPETSLVQPAIGILGWESGLRMIDHAGLVTPGLFFYNDLRCTPMSEVIARHSPDLVLISQWSPAQLEPLGYRPIHRFEQPFVYTLFERHPG